MPGAERHFLAFTEPRKRLRGDEEVLCEAKRSLRSVRPGAPWRAVVWARRAEDWNAKAFAHYKKKLRDEDGRGFGASCCAGALAGSAGPSGHGAEELRGGIAGRRLQPPQAGGTGVQSRTWCRAGAAPPKAERALDQLGGHRGVRALPGCCPTTDARRVNLLTMV